MGIIGTIHLKYGSSASLIATIICISGSYFHMHISSKTKELSVNNEYHLSLLFGLSSISWSGHKIHIGLPANRLLDSGIDPVLIPCAQELGELETAVLIPCPYSGHHLNALHFKFKSCTII